jgi:hypothetical protein
MDSTYCTPRSRDEAVEKIRDLLTMLSTEFAWTPDGSLLTGHRLNVVAGGRRFYGYYADAPRLAFSGFAAAEVNRGAHRHTFTAVLLPLEFRAADDGQILLVVHTDPFGGRVELPLEQMHVDLRVADA